MKSTEKKHSSLSAQLIRTYLVLTVAVFLAILLLRVLVDYRLNSVLPPNDVPGLLRVLERQTGDTIDARTVSTYLGRDAAVSLFAADGRFLADSRGNTDSPFSQSEIDVIPAYDGNTFYGTIDFQLETGEKRHLVIVESGIAEASAENGYFVLDEDLNVLESSLPLAKTSYTPREFNFLVSRYDSGHEIYKQAYTRTDGAERIAVLSFAPVNYSYYGQAVDVWQYTWIAMLILYVILVVVSIWRLNEKTKRLLTPLTVAVGNLLSDKKAAPIAYEGPQEFVDLYDSFNRLSHQLNESEQARRRLDDEKDRMLADISHDLRTPTTVIQGYAEALNDGLVPEERKAQYLKTIVTKSEQITRLIDSVFEFSLLGHPNLPNVFKVLDLTAFLQTYLADKYMEIDLAGFVLDVSLPETPLYAAFDKLQLSRVFDNLLNNAMSHNEPGTTISVSLAAAGEWLELLFANDGEIPASLRDTIFLPFVVKDDARASSGHSGLGLAITAKIVDRHGGSISLVETAPPGQTVFCLRLPRVQKPADMPNHNDQQA